MLNRSSFSLPAAAVSASVMVLFAFSSSPVNAADGHDLLEQCEAVAEQKRGGTLDEVGRIKAAKCLSYLSGFGGADALSPLTRKGRRMFCIPKDVSLTDAALATVSWMQKNPDKLKFGAHEVLAMANIVNYPCAPKR